MLRRRDRPVGEKRMLFSKCTCSCISPLTGDYKLLPPAAVTGVTLLSYWPRRTRGEDLRACDSRFNVGLRRFNEMNGRHEETRTPDLYRVDQPLACDINNLTEHGSHPICLKRKVRANSGYAIVHGWCTA